MKTIFYILGLIFILVATNIELGYSDPGLPPDMNCADPPCAIPVPIDGGISLLIAAGVAYGSKKAYDNKKK